VLIEGRHPVYNPAVDKDCTGDHGNDNNEFLTVDKFAMGEVPIEGDE